MKFQQQLSFNRALSHHQLIRILIDPVMIIMTLIFIVVGIEGKLTSQYIVLIIILFALSFPGSWQGSKNLLREVGQTLTQWLSMVSILLLFGYVTGYLDSFPINVTCLWLSVTPAVLICSHVVANYYLTSQHYLAYIKKSAVIVGVNELSHQLYDRINASVTLGVEIKGFFDVLDEQSAQSEQLNNAHLSSPFLGGIEALPNYVRQHDIDIIYIALPPSLHSQILMLLDDLKDTTASIYFVPNFFMADLIQARIDDINGMPIVAMCETPFTGVNGMIKRLSDMVFASFILCLILPLLIIIAIGVKLSSSGPILFKQRRYGLDGREITVYKFRSMNVSEDGEHVVQAKVNDTRVTKFGKFIRRTSLDELPQFINVLQGRMSIVGPRPHAISHNEIYRKLIKGYMVRHKVKPGITGLAQVNGFRGETQSVAAMKSRIEYDLEYLNKWSLCLDMKIIFKTIFLVFTDKNAY